MDKYYIENLVLVEGGHKNSTLLDKAIQLTDENYRVLYEWTEKLGLNHTVFFRGGRWLPQKERNNWKQRRHYVLNLRNILSEHGSYLQQLRRV